MFFLGTSSALFVCLFVCLLQKKRRKKNEDDKERVGGVHCVPIHYICHISSTNKILGSIFVNFCATQGGRGENRRFTKDRRPSVK